MARRQWKFVVRTADREAKNVEVSRVVAQFGIGVMFLLVAGLGTGAVHFFGWAGTAAREHRLSRENALLAGQLATLRTEIDTLRTSLSGLERQDEFYRLLAGLDPLHDEVREVGIGGPGLATVESNPLYGFDEVLAGRTHDAFEDVGTLVRRAQLLSFSWREARDTLASRQAQLSATPSILPTDGWISSGFSSSRYHPILSRPMPHLGLDIVAEKGSPIVAAAKGRVKSVGRSGGYGLMVEIDHGWGVVTRYAHASKTLVRLGQPVERGEAIAEVGMTGLAVAPHVHYEVWVDGRPTNPRRYLFEPDVLPD